MEDEDDHLSDGAALDNEPDHALHDQVSPKSFTSMDSADRADLIQSFETSASEITDQGSMEWDHNSLTVNLSDPLLQNRLFTSQSESDDVFSPNLEIPPSPISPDQRITRQLVKSGAYARHATSS